MSPTAVHSNVFLKVARRGCAPRFQRCHNLVLNQGLDALAYNMTAGTASNGGQVNRILYSTSTVAPVATDTAVAGTILTSKMIGGAVSAHGVAFWHFKLPVDPGDELSVNGNTIAKIGLRTHDSGAATASDDKVIAAALLSPAVAKDEYTEIEGVWIISFSPQAGSGEQWPLLWRRFLASKLVDLSLYGVMDYVAFGSGSFTGKIAPEGQTLASEQYRRATTWTATGASVACNATLTQAQYNAGTLTENGPAIGSTAGQLVLARKGGFSVNMTAGDGNFAITIDLSRG